MFMSRLNSLPPVGNLRNEMDRLLGEFFGPEASTTPRSVFPPLNIWESQDDLYAEAELPGLKPEEVDVSVVGNELIIKGRLNEFDQQEVAYHRRERRVGEFTRTVRLPIQVEADKVEASLRDGVLSIRLPKAQAAKPRKIAIST